MNAAAAREEAIMTDTESAPLMRAIRVHRYGPPEELVEEQVARPEPDGGGVLVRVQAAGVGPWDAWTRAGRSAVPQALPLIPGSDVSGIAVALGPNLTGLRPGDEVYGVTNPNFTGGYSEYCVARAAMLAPKPLSLDFIGAAAVPVVAVTAWQMLFDYGHLQPGQTVLIHGAAGNVGACAVQLAHEAGAIVLGTGSSADRDHVLGLGASEIIDYRQQRFEDTAHDVDLVLDTVGGETLARSFSVLRAGGVLVSSVSKPDQSEAARHDVTATFFLVEVTSERLLNIAQHIDSRKLTVEVGEVLELGEARVAHRMLEGAPHRRGKIILQVRE